MPKDLQYDDEDLDIADLQNEVASDDDSFTDENDSNQENFNQFKIEKKAE